MMCKRASSQRRRILVVRARTSRTSIAGYMSVSRRDPSRGDSEGQDHPRDENVDGQRYSDDEQAQQADITLFSR